MKKKKTLPNTFSGRSDKRITGINMRSQNETDRNAVHSFNATDHHHHQHHTLTHELSLLPVFFSLFDSK